MYYELSFFFNRKTELCKGMMLIALGETFLNNKVGYRSMVSQRNNLGF